MTSLVTGREAEPVPTEPRGMDWESFFKNYRQPDFVPGYLIQNKLGSGVFGEVYKAQKTSIGKTYAIKFLKVMDDHLSEQVVRELQSINHFAQVDHPNLVSIEDRGEVSGIPYIVMGYAGDETLKVLLQRGRLENEQALSIFRQILCGVKALHEHGLIHFDLKPANIFIRGEVARVGDYGLSKLMSESRATLSMGRGTPHYMAPEMLQRRGDARSDVYSLGVLLFEMLTGDVPFTGETEWEILRRHENDAPAIPGSIPAPLSGFMARALDKSPERRFTSAGEALLAFERATSERLGSDSLGNDGKAMDSLGANRPIIGPKVANTAAKAGAQVGRWAAKGRASIEKVHREVQDVLARVRDETQKAYQSASKAPKGPVPGPPPLPNAKKPGLRFRALAKGGRFTGSIARAAGRSIVFWLAWPFNTSGRVAVSGLKLLAILCMIGVVLGLVHLGLKAAIL